MKLDVLLVELWAAEERYRLISDNIGIACLKAMLDANTHLATGMLNSQQLYFASDGGSSPLQAIADYVSDYYAQNPQLVLGVSATQWRLPELKELLTIVRARHPALAVMAGGYGPTFAPDAVLSFGASALCIGEGDNTVVPLVQALRGEIDLARVQGIAYLHDGRPVFTDRRQLVDVRALPPPSLDYLNGRILDRAEYTYANRGCPHRCGFCFIHRFYGKGEGSAWRPKTAAQIYEELRDRRRRNPRLEVVLFGDDNFLVAPGLLPELRTLFKSDPLCQDLQIEFGAGAVELNRSWHTIEECMDVIYKIELGYESRVPGFLLRQKKGPARFDMARENRQAVSQLQAARREHPRFDYALFHIIGDRQTTLEELGQIYPTDENIDKLEWAVKILRNGPNVVMYFDERDRRYPLYIRAYCHYFDALCKLSDFLAWIADNVDGWRLAKLESMLADAFGRAYELAALAYDRHGSQRGLYVDLAADLRQQIEQSCRDDSNHFHRFFASYMCCLAEHLLLASPVSALLARPWFPGYAVRLLERFPGAHEANPPAYIRLFAALFEGYEANAQTLRRLAQRHPQLDQDAVLQVGNRALVGSLRATVNRTINCTPPHDSDPASELAIMEAGQLIDDLADDLVRRYS